MSIDRRSFIKLTAVTGGAAAIAACGRQSREPADPLHPRRRSHAGNRGDEERRLPDLSAPDAARPSASCRATPTSIRDGQPGVMTMSLAKKLDGNPSHPVSQGKLCPRGQASIQITYHPDRLTQPLKREGARGSGEYQPITWDAAIAELTARLDARRRNQLSRADAPRRRASRNDLSRCSSTSPARRRRSSFELFSDDVLRRANLLSFGREQLPTFDFANSRASHLVRRRLPRDVGLAVVAERRLREHAAADARASAARWCRSEPRMSLTGASADEWVAIRPGTEGVLALGLANALGDKMQPRSVHAGGSRTAGRGLRKPRASTPARARMLER